MMHPVHMHDVYTLDDQMHWWSNTVCGAKDYLCIYILPIHFMHVLICHDIYSGISDAPSSNKSIMVAAIYSLVMIKDKVAGCTILCMLFKLISCSISLCMWKQKLKDNDFQF